MYVPETKQELVIKYDILKKSQKKEKNPFEFPTTFIHPPATNDQSDKGTIRVDLLPTGKLESFSYKLIDCGENKAIVESTQSGSNSFIVDIDTNVDHFLIVEANETKPQEENYSNPRYNTIRPMSSTSFFQDKFASPNESTLFDNPKSEMKKETNVYYKFIKAEPESTPTFVIPKNPEPETVCDPESEPLIVKDLEIKPNDTNPVEYESAGVLDSRNYVNPEPVDQLHDKQYGQRVKENEEKNANEETKLEQMHDQLCDTRGEEYNKFRDPKLVEFKTESTRQVGLTEEEIKEYSDWLQDKANLISSIKEIDQPIMSSLEKDIEFIRNYNNKQENGSNSSFEQL